MHSAKLVGTATTVSTLICAVLRRKGSRGLQIRDAWGSLFLLQGGAEKNCVWGGGRAGQGVKSLGQGNSRTRGIFGAGGAVLKYFGARRAGATIFPRAGP